MPYISLSRTSKKCDKKVIFAILRRRKPLILSNEGCEKNLVLLWVKSYSINTYGQK